MKAIGHGNGGSKYYEEGNDGSNDDGYIFNIIDLNKDLMLIEFNVNERTVDIFN